MPAKGPCPKCAGQFVELERSGIKIDACRECRGVFLDRGELDQIIAAEQRQVASVYEDDEAFFREMTGQAAPAAPAAPPASTPAPAPVAAAPQPTHAPPAQQPAYTPPPQPPAYSPPPQQPMHTPPPQQPLHAPAPQASIFGAPAHGGHGQQSQYHHQKYGIDLKTAERLLGDFRSHQTSHKKKKQKSLLHELFD